MLKELKFIYDGGQSKRFHTVDVQHTQDIAAHSFGVAWMCELLTRGRASKNLIMSALSHDLAEHMVGDIPSPAKRAMNIGHLFHEAEMKHLRTAGLPYQDELSEGEAYTLKLADMLDGCMYCIRERTYGNRNLDVPFNRFYSYATEVWRDAKQDPSADGFLADPEMVDLILIDIMFMWKEVTK